MTMRPFTPSLRRKKTVASMRRWTAKERVSALPSRSQASTATTATATSICAARSRCVSTHLSTKNLLGGQGNEKESCAINQQLGISSGVCLRLRADGYIALDEFHELDAGAYDSWFDDGRL